MESEKAFLGVGWGFPIRLDERGRIATVAYEEDIREAIRIILGTNANERMMRPDFGADLDSMVFEPVNPTTLALIRSRVETALIDRESRIDVDQVSVREASSGRHEVLIEVRYRVRATNALQNLVYPFYLAETATQ